MFQHYFTIIFIYNTTDVCYFAGDYKSSQFLVCSNDGITDEKQIGKRLKKEDGAIHDAATGN